MDGQVEFTYARGTVQLQCRRRGSTEDIEVRAERSDVAPRDGTRESCADPEGSGIAQRLFDQASVDRERTSLVEPGHPAQLGDGIE